MSASLDRLTADVGAAIKKITDLETTIANLTAQVGALQSAQGTPDASLDALSAELEAATTEQPAAAPTPTTAPAS